MGVGTSLLTRCLLLKKTRGVGFLVAFTGGHLVNRRRNWETCHFKEVSWIGVALHCPCREQTCVPTKPPITLTALRASPLPVNGLTGASLYGVAQLVCVLDQ